ncbi:MAG TPA: LacI family DNA-binding transcriptional regulator [Acidimicrobiales bacterium]|nr:LacI family DNA-binding transcriptional regulator [Acidimicrobiales bacterium]
MTSPSQPTVRELAREANVSPATVSRVLRDSPGVSAPRRAAVLGAIERHGLTGKPSRRPPVPQHRLVVVRCPYVFNDVFGALLSAVARSLREAGKRALLSVEAGEGREPDISELLLPDRTEGAILILPPEPVAVIRDLRASGYPFVVITPRTPLPSNVAAVSAANMAGARAATEYLLGLGHERIAMIGGPSHWIATEGRIAGYRAGLATYQKLAPAEYIYDGGEPTVRQGYVAGRTLLALRKPPTAIIAFNDKMAAGAMRAATDNGLRVPRDLSIVGFDGLEVSEVVEPRLTTVRQPIDEMARLGVELLVRLIEGRDIETLQVVLSNKLVIGGSTGPVPLLANRQA